MTYAQPRRMRVGDLAPDLRITIASEDPDFDPDALTSVRVVGAIDGTVIFDRPGNATISGGGLVVSMPFEADDTDQPGRVVVEVVLNWPGNKTQTIRADNILLITSDLT